MYNVLVLISICISIAESMQIVYSDNHMKKRAVDCMEVKNIVDDILVILDDKKAESVQVINLEEKSAYASWMIVATANSTRQVHALYQYIEDYFKKNGIIPHVEGLQQCEWVLIYGNDVVIHLFLPETRDFYQLEKMWHSHFEDGEHKVLR